MDARARGAEILLRTRCVEARREGGQWIAKLKDLATGTERVVKARILVNAAGPWVERVLHGVAGQSGSAHMRLVKGSHIVVPRLFEGDHAYILQNTDRRVIFAIPYEHRFTLIGTTDIPFEGDASDVKITPEETAYLCDAVNRYFAKQIGPADVVRSYSGVRPLYDDDSSANPSTVTRDYVFDLAGSPGEAPLLSIYGGKITTYRRLAEHAMDKLTPFIPDLRPSWTADAALPGGDMASHRFEPFAAAFKTRHPGCPRMSPSGFAGSMAPWRSGSSGPPPSWPTWESISAAGFMSGRSTGWFGRNGRTPPTISCGAGPSLAFTSRPKGRCGWRNGWPVPAHWRGRADPRIGKLGGKIAPARSPAL